LLGRDSTVSRRSSSTISGCRIQRHQGGRIVARVTTYLNFPRTAEAAFTHYRTVFGTELAGPIARFGDTASPPGQPPMPEADKSLVIHIALPILGGHVLMGTDAPESMGFTLTPGNNVYINLEPDTRVEADRLFAGLAEGGTVETPLQEMFWGGYFGSLVDRFGIQWMFNCTSKV
jgi:PhnB protein